MTQWNRRSESEFKGQLLDLNQKLKREEQRMQELMNTLNGSNKNKNHLQS